MIEGFVSTIIPVYNRPGMLVEAVDSVLAQTYRPIEIIIVDDGSTDDTGAVAERLAREYSEVVRVVHQSNGGTGRAREAGRVLARGEFIQYLDSDDRLLPRKFEVQVAALQERSDCDIAYGVCVELTPDGQPDPSPLRPSDRIMNSMFPGFLCFRTWNTPSPLYRRTLCDRIGSWTDLRVEEDWEYDCRAAALWPRLAFVLEAVCEVHASAHNRTSRGRPDDAARNRHRARAHESVYRSAMRAGIPRTVPEFRQFARSLFLLARQCGISGLEEESRRLYGLAREASVPGSAGGTNLYLYGLLGRVLGWVNAARLASAFERVRSVAVPSDSALRN